MVEGEEREGVLVVGGRMVHEADEERGTPYFWWRRRHDRVGGGGIRCVWWLDVAERRWSLIMLFCG